MKTQPILATNDNGYADHKVAWFDEQAQRIKTLKVPAVVGAGHTVASTLGDIVGGYTVIDTEQKFTCSNTLDNPVDLRHSSYPTSVENRVIFTHALNTAGLLDHPVQMCVTLPLDDYYLPGGRINTELVDKVKNNFSTCNVRVDSKENLGKTAQVSELRVTPEAVAAWFDWALDDNGQVTSHYMDMLDEHGVVLVVDVGGSTTDIVALSLTPDLAVLHEKSATTKIGVLDVVELMEKGFLEQMREQGILAGGGHESILTAKHRQDFVMGSSIRLGGTRFDITQLRQQCAKTVAARIVNFIQQMAGNALSYHSIIVAGGGSIVFKEALGEHLGTGAVFLDEFANARGALKLMLSSRA